MPIHNNECYWIFSMSLTFATKESCPFTIRSAKLDSDEAEWTLTYTAMKRLSRYFTTIHWEVQYSGLFTRQSRRMLSSHSQSMINNNHNTMKQRRHVLFFWKPFFLNQLKKAPVSYWEYKRLAKKTKLLDIVILLGPPEQINMVFRKCLF